MVQLNSHVVNINIQICVLLHHQEKFTALEEICINFIQAGRDDFLQVGVCCKPLANQ